MNYDMEIKTLESIILDKASKAAKELTKPIRTKYSVSFVTCIREFYTLYIDGKLRFCVNINDIAYKTLYFSYIFNSKYHNSYVKIKNEAKHLIIPENGVYTAKLDDYTFATAIVANMNYDYDSDDAKSVKISIVGKNAQSWFRRIKHGSMKLYCSYLSEESGYIIVNKRGKNKVVYPKNMDDIVMDADVKKSVMEQINNFMHNKKAYRAINNPYKLGILIKGEPGTGKSSFAYSLAKMVGCSVRIIQPEEIKSDSPWQVLSSAEPGRKPSFSASNRQNYGAIPDEQKTQFNVLLIEEIDSLMDANKKLDIEVKEEEPTEDGYDVLDSEISWHAKRRSRSRLVSEPLRRDQIFRFIDDLPENTILVATTNFYETLDKALIRPGRFDIKFSMDNFNEQQALEMVSKYGFDESFLEQYKGKYPICPAVIQYDMVQKKCEDIVKGEKE